ncbi:MAG: glycosyltransferase [Alphaproteobacteria bacterium]
MLTGDLAASAGGLAASVPGMVNALEDTAGVEVHVLGTRVEGEPHPAGVWGRRAHAHAQYGPRAFHWAPALGRTLRRLNPDLVDVQGLWMHSSRVSLAHHRRTRRPYVVTPRGMLDPWSLAYARWKKRLAATWFEDAHLRHAACIRATSLLEAGHVRSYGLRQPIAVVPNGVELPPDRSTPQRASPGRRLLFLSRIHPKKGLPHLLRAWAALAHRHRDWELVLAGPNEVGHTAEMQALATDLGAPRVTWIGPVEGEAKDALYRSADLFVLPTHAENFGLVVAEALAHGVPVVTTRNAPWDGLETQRCGWWIELDDGALREALAAAMTLGDAERRAMGSRGRAWMERDFAWPAVARQLSEVYAWLVGGGRTPDCVLTA